MPVLQNRPPVNQVALFFFLLANLCKQHQKRIDSLSIEEYFTDCPIQTIQERAESGELTLPELTKCYHPDCLQGEYVQIQCSDIAPEWCWCSDPQGIAIEGTLKKGLKEEDCSKLHKIKIPTMP